MPYYWIVDTDARTINVYRASAGAYGSAERRDAGALDDLAPFPGLRIDTARLWR